MRRLLVITHRPIGQDGGPAARWRAFARYLPEHGWEVDALSATAGTGAAEFEARAARAVARRASVMARVGRLSEPLLAGAGVRPDALPPSLLWAPRGALALRRQIERRRPDVVLATGPPIAGPLAGRLGSRACLPLIVELRDLWAANPAFDAGGGLLQRAEDWLLRDARRVVACTPEAVCDLRRRHPQLSERVVEVANGFDPEILSVAQCGAQRDPLADGGAPATLTLLHSGTLTPARPIGPVIQALQDGRVAGCVRLVLHGYLSPASRAEVERARRAGGPPIELVAPSPWKEAVRRIASADACLITQARAAGDETAIASKVYEYLALGRPVLCVSDGGATEALLRRLGADELCARLDRPQTIVAALLRLRAGAVHPPARERLGAYDRRALAGRMAALLEEVASG